MKKPIKIDLRNLTKRKLSMAKPNVGAVCEYAAPCIIGTLVPPNRRSWLDGCADSTTIGDLKREGIVEIPVGQLADAKEMQAAFDEGDWERVEEIAQPYLEQQAA